MGVDGEFLTFAFLTLLTYLTYLTLPTYFTLTSPNSVGHAGAVLWPGRSQG